jgi:hypothetical protein
MKVLRKTSMSRPSLSRLQMLGSQTCVANTVYAIVLTTSDTYVTEFFPQTTWTSSSDSADPYNWPTSRKYFIGTIFSFGQLIPIMSASMIAPSLADIARDLHISAATAQITLSSYFLGMAFAPLLIASLSEMYGRKKVWVACNVWYILWNAMCPVSNIAGLMIVGRIMSGMGASVGVTVSSHSVLGKQC